MLILRFLEQSFPFFVIIDRFCDSEREDFFCNLHFETKAKRGMIFGIRDSLLSYGMIFEKEKDGGIFFLFVLVLWINTDVSLIGIQIVLNQKIDYDTISIKQEKWVERIKRSK